MKNIQCYVDYLPLGLTRSTSSPECLSQLALINRTTWSWVCSAMSWPLISTTWSPSFNRGTQRSACNIIKIRFQICTWFSKSKALKFIFIGSIVELKLHIEKHLSIHLLKKWNRNLAFPWRYYTTFFFHSTTFPLMPYYMHSHTDKTSYLEMPRHSQASLCTIQICTNFSYHSLVQLTSISQ